MSLPNGLTTRPLVLGDASAVTAVMMASELADLGEVVIEEADIVGEWQRPSFDVGSSTIGVFDGDRLVGYGEHSGGERADGSVHPAYRGRGIGTWVAQWIVAKAGERGVGRVGMPVPAGSPGEALLRGLGWEQRWESWVLRLPEGVQVADQVVPQGFSLREATPDEYAAVWEVVEDAFLEWSVRERESYPDFAAQTVLRPGFEPWHLRVAVDPQGVVVGTALLMVTDDGCCYIAKLAVRRDLRGRGLARALLADAFGEGRRHGSERFELSTDSRTGALALYEHVGMVVTSRWVNLATQTGA